MHSETATLPSQDSDNRKLLQRHSVASKRRRKMFKTEAATIIQKAFRAYMRKTLVKRLNNEVVMKFRPDNLKKKPNGGKILELFREKNKRFHISYDRGNIMNGRRGMSRQTLVDEESLCQSPTETVLVFGGTDTHNDFGVGKNTGKNIFGYCVSENKWEFVGELPEPRHYHSVLFLQGRVFLVGGTNPKEEIKGNFVILGSTWSFDPATKNWFNESSLLEARKSFGLVSYKQNLYAIGGQGEDFQSLQSVERFNIEDRVWEPVASLIYSRIGPACAKYKDYIWVAGGLSEKKNKRTLLDSVECYNLLTDQWTEIRQKLPFPRCFSCMSTLNETLYLIGGAGKSTENEGQEVTSVGNIDVWDPKTVEWKTITETHIARHGHTVAYFGTQIFIIGGVTTAYKRALSNTECFCSQRGTLIRGLACLPLGLSGHSAVTLPPN